MNSFKLATVGTSLLTMSLLAGGGLSQATAATQQDTVTMSVELNDKELDNLVRRSYQYVAMYNVIQKFALDPASDRMFTDGFNKPVASTALADHNMTSIARTQQ